MSECGNFYKPNEIKNLYEEVTPVYQNAFAGEPWFEVSKCVDTSSIQRCMGGFSSLPIGETCEMCGDCPIKSAYEKVELIDNFEMLANTRPTAWYMERNEDGVTLAAVSWRSTPEEIVSEKYAGVPDMAQWMEEKLRGANFIWLDEVFANKLISPSGNLANFEAMCLGLAQQLNADTIAYRTINGAMTYKAESVFGKNATIYNRESEVPDRRDFVIINLEEQK